MQLKFRNWSDYHHQIYRIYHGIIAISLVPFFLVFLELEVTSIKQPRVENFLIWFILLTGIPFCFYLSWSVWKGDQFKYELDRKLSIKEKLISFRTLEIKKYVWLEIACAISLLGLWLTAHYLFVISYFAILAQFSFLRPSEDRLVKSMRLSKEERKRMHEEIFS